MAKGVYKISGNTTPKVLEKNTYKVEAWYPETPYSERDSAKVTWELFVEENGKFRTTHIKKKGIGDFTFGKNAYKHTYKIEGYLYAPEGKEPMSLVIRPQKNDGASLSNEKEILGVRLTYEDGSKITKPLSYMDRLMATAKCQNLEGRYIIFELWEDDEKGSGHNKKNQSIIKSQPIRVDSRGYASWNFTLLNTFISLAQQREGEDKKHEYYVTAEYNGKILNNSGNINVNNPTPVIKITPKSSSKSKTTSTNNPQPKPQPNSAKGSTHQGSKNNQSDDKGIITSIKITDLKGQFFKKRPKFGERIQIVIEGKSIKGKDYTLRLWEDDTTGKNDLLYERKYKFDDNKQVLYVDLTEDMQRVGEIGNNSQNPDYGEYWTGNYQEIFAEVIINTKTAQSQIINVDLKAEAKKPEKTRTPTKVGETKKKEEKGTCVCKENQFYWSSKLTCEERKKVLQVCEELWGEENKKQKASELMSVIHLETNKTFSPSADNGAGYSGLIQFSDASAKSVGTTRSALKKMTFVEQMDYVKKYFEKRKNLLNTMTDLYLLVLKQNAVGQGGNANYILFDESISVPNVPYNKDNLSKEPWVTKYGYSSNPPFMREKGEWQNKRMFQSYSKGLIERRGFPNGKTYVWEVTDKLTKEHYNLGSAEIFNGTCENVSQSIKKTNGKYPPWVDIAIEEEGKIIRENTHCQYIISTYHASTDNAKMKKCTGKGRTYDHEWCAAFVNYCLETSGHQSQQDPGARWYKDINRVKRNDKGEPYHTQEIWAKKHETMYIGGIVVWTNNAHTTIVVGIDKSNPNNYIYLGGNQDNGVRFWTAPKSKVHNFCLFPIDYTGDLLPLEQIEPSDLRKGAVKYNQGSTS